MKLPALYALVLALAPGGLANAYDERLDITPLTGEHWLVSFDFNLSSAVSHHHQLFPRVLEGVLASSNASELHLRFGQGYWDADNWGLTPNNGANVAGTGVELWARIAADSYPDAEASWFSLANSLSGMFCASLNFIDSAHTTSPKSVLGAFDTNHSLYLFHGSLPSEPVCTENLTPYLKLLPCKGAAGVSSLLDGHHLFESQWQSMSIDLSVEDGRLHLRQSIYAVLHVDRTLERRINPVPEPEPYEAVKCDSSRDYSNPQNGICYPRIPGIGEINVTLSDLFGSPIKNGACLSKITSKSPQICLHIPSDNWSVTASDELSPAIKSVDQICYVIPPDSDFDLSIHSETRESVLPKTPSPILASRHLVGWGQERGGFHSVYKSTSGDSPVSFVTYEVLPWFMRVYLHSFTYTLFDSAGAEVATGSFSASNVSSDIAQLLYYKPAQPRVSPSHIEMLLTIPAGSKLVTMYQFEKSLLYYNEYPPDANRGFDISPAIVEVLTDSSSPRAVFRTTSSLLSLPTPDFSMPYNVIILTSTVIALAFGTIFNLVTRTFVYAEDLPKQSLAKKLRAKLSKITSMFS
ncbi:hypothetical protein CANCADRAFT_25352 [Tortispora caseinolytica NRRL Y-17796]|uniref:GPI transamidase component GPI16 n=1 Tax=Tortispora caseinolytica NRRL Y-17796 TaxID=767744 RepID=A0A1E4TI12_9ASCO|nr:hypothetical protein CANCADRAFT_25352 [Tortispora caseinolytica NRRL Y-17796]